MPISSSAYSAAVCTQCGGSPWTEATRRARSQATWRPAWRGSRDDRQPRARGPTRYERSGDPTRPCRSSASRCGSAREARDCGRRGAREARDCVRRGARRRARRVGAGLRADTPGAGGAGLRAARAARESRRPRQSPLLSGESLPWPGQSARFPPGVAYATRSGCRYPSRASEPATKGSGRRPLARKMIGTRQWRPSGCRRTPPRACQCDAPREYGHLHRCSGSSPGGRGSCGAAVTATCTAVQAQVLAGEAHAAPRFKPGHRPGGSPAVP